MSHSRPQVQHAEGLTTIILTSGRDRGAEYVIGAELEGLTEDLGKGDLVLDCRNVVYLSSVELGTIIQLHKRVAVAGRHLTLIGLNKQVYEVFTVTKLDTILDVRPDKASI